MGKIEWLLRPAAGHPKELHLDIDWYRDTYGLDPSWTAGEVKTFAQEWGDKMGHNLSPYFNPRFVRSQLEAIGVEVAVEDGDVRDPYLENSDRIDPHPMLPRAPDFRLGHGKTKRAEALEWFNQSVYLLRRHDVQGTRHGLFFDPSFVLDADGGPAERPLETYLRRHAHDDMQVSALFDPHFYRATYPDLVRQIAIRQLPVQNLLEHFVTHGIHENRLPFPDFDPGYYARQYSDVAEDAEQKKTTLIHHFLFHGLREHRDPNPYFNSRYYIDTQPHIPDEIREMRLFGPFEHFLKVGYKAGLRANQPLYQVTVPERMAKASYERRCEQVTRKIMREGSRITFPIYEGTIRISCIIPVVDQGHMTLNLLEQLSGIAWRRDMPEIEVIVVDNGSTDVTAELKRLTEGVSVIRCDVPLGYPGACNRGAAVARGDVLLFMNNDIEPNADALRHGLKRLTDDASIGAVGGKIILMNGLLQEAGSMLFLDGSARGIGRHADPDDAEFNIAREVDYCSGCFLFVRRDDFEALDGFDEVFSPGYYEEADLCLRLKERGLSTIYDPRIDVRHYEYASYSKGRPASVSTALIRRNREVFAHRHRRRLAELPVAHGDGWRRRWLKSRQGAALSIALVEDFVPDPAIGSGFVRSADVIDRLIEAGHRVTVFASHYMSGVDAERLRRSGVPVVECYLDGASANPFEGREWSFDVLWICRTHNIRPWTRWATTIKAVNPELKVVFDTEAIDAFRKIAYHDLRGVALRHSEDDLIATELDGELPPDLIIAVNETDRAAVEARALAPVRELGHRVLPRRDAPGPDGRRGLFFCGAFHDEDSPNFDSMVWMIKEIWPLILASVPEAEFTIAGHLAPHVKLRKLVEAAADVTYLGRVAALSAHMDAARVFVAPTRYSGGIPHKVHEALATGIPVVCTDRLRSQLATADVPAGRVPVLSAPVGDAARFAEACIALLNDDARWRELQGAGFDFIDATASDRVFTRQMEDVLNVL